MAVLACSSSYWGDRGKKIVSSRPAWAIWRNLASNNLSQSTVQWQIIYLSMHRAWVQVPVLLKEKSNQNKIIIIKKKKLHWAGKMSHRMNDSLWRQMTLGWSSEPVWVKERTASCRLFSDLHMILLEHVRAHMCSNSGMAISLPLVHTGSARCHCYHELNLCTMLSLSLWAGVPWNADKIVCL